MKGSLILFFLKIFSFLPLKVNHQVATFFGLYSYYLNLKSKKIALINIQTCFPKKSALWQQQLTKKSLVESAKAATELGLVWHWNLVKLAKLIKIVKGGDVLIEAQNKKKGIILVGLHFGSWELACLSYLPLKPVTFLYTEPKINKLDQPLRNFRSRFGLTLAPANTKGVKILIKSLQNNETIGLLPDQNPANGTGIFSSFYGQPCYTMTFLSKLSNRTGATIVFSLLERLPNGSGYIKHYIKPDIELYSNDTQTSVNALNKMIEKCIAINPEQYLWSYKRFKTAKDGKPNIYS